MESDTDYSLLKKISTSDDEKSFKILFQRYYAPLCLFSKRYIFEKEIREDIVEEVFTTIWDKRKEIDINSSFKNYLITSVKNLSLNYIRKQSYKQEYESKIIKEGNSFMESTDDLYNMKELEEMLYNILMRLPEEHRIAFEMSNSKNYTMDEIAKRIGVSKRTVERYRDKALELLKKELKEYMPIIITMV